MKYILSVLSTSPSAFAMSCKSKATIFLLSWDMSLRVDMASSCDIVKTWSNSFCSTCIIKHILFNNSISLESMTPSAAIIHLIACIIAFFSLSDNSIIKIVIKSFSVN